MKTQVGKSLTADFQENTWTFEMKENFIITAGDFAVIPIRVLLELTTALKGIRNSMNVHPDCEPDSEFQDMVDRVDEILEKLE